jgi:voltage-gated potassium channel
MADTDFEARQVLEHERTSILQKLDDWLEKPMIVLGIIWLALLVVELTRGLSPLLNVLSTAIWIVFIVDFLVRFAIAPRKLGFLKANWLTLLALILPALRVLRAARFVRLARLGRSSRSLRLVRVVTSVNRGMSSLGATLHRRGFAYVLGVSGLVLIAGAAGMYAFEGGSSTGFDSFGNALWWTAMLLTTMGSEAWPGTPEGRFLCLALALYAFAIWGYVTATLATFFIGQDTGANAGGQTPRELDLEQLRIEIVALRNELRQRREGTT